MRIVPILQFGLGMVKAATLADITPLDSGREGGFLGVDGIVIEGKDVITRRETFQFVTQVPNSVQSHLSNRPNIESFDKVSRMNSVSHLNAIFPHIHGGLRSLGVPLPIMVKS